MKNTDSWFQTYYTGLRTTAKNLHFKCFWGAVAYPAERTRQGKVTVAEVRAEQTSVVLRRRPQAADPMGSPRGGAVERGAGRQSRLPRSGCTRTLCQSLFSLVLSFFRNNPSQTIGFC